MQKRVPEGYPAVTTRPDSSASTARADDAAATERLRLRYPPPLVSRRTKTVLVAVVVAIALTWLVWAALAHSRPAVAGQVSAFDITSDTSMSVEVTVQRRDPGQAAGCRVLVQSIDFQPVAEVEVVAPPGEHELVQVDATLTTLRRATSAKVTNCRVIKP